MTNNRRKLAVRGRVTVVAVLACLAAVGCGRRSGEASLSGKITYQGALFDNGFVAVRSESDGTMVRSAIGPDGSYLIKNVPVGKVKILVLTPPKHPRGPRSGDKDGTPSDPLPTAGPEGGIPLKYADPITSPYEMEIRPGGNEFSADLS